MSFRLIVATKNKKKLSEIKEILKGVDLKISSLGEFKDCPRIIENGRTFKDNAVKKAVKTAHFFRELTLGEDSGLCVDVLGGRPGVFSARFSGKPACRTGRNKSDLQNNQKLLRLLKYVPVKKRKAHYVCVVAIADENGLVGVTEGKCHGLIGFEPKGSHGFGYDPLFVIPKYKKTFAELGEGIKHKMSHRFHALKKAKKILQKYIEKHKGS